MEFLGVDIGGSGIKAAIVDVKTGELISKRYRLPTPQPSEPHAVADVVCHLLEHFNWNGPVGVSFPTVIKNGKAVKHSNMDPAWKNMQVDDLFSEHCKGQFFVCNDADAAAIAEMAYGAGCNKDGLIITITIGTGLGSGVFFNGKLLPNFELGSLYGKNGDIIERYAADSVRKRKDLSYKAWGKRLRFFLKHVEETMHPDMFILGGGVSKRIDKYSQYLDIETPFVTAEKQNNAGIIGAAMFAESQLVNS